jgi:hypothetical protein
MIKVDYFGRTGNNLFQWVFARLFAERNGLGIITQPPKFYYPIKPSPGGVMNMNMGETVIDDTIARHHEQNYLLADHSKESIRLHGYWQDAKYYHDRDKIKEFFDLLPAQRNTEDIVIHLRLTDYWWHRVRSVIDPQWYIKILRGQRFKTCYIVVESHPTNRRYLHQLQSVIKSSIIISQTPEEDFEFIRQFDRIICSNSTFAWWAAYLSDARRIWTFKPWIRNDSIPLAGMPGAEVVDGSFANDVKLSQVHWNEYWLKQ